MRVLIAPDSFGGTLTAAEAAAAIAAGWRAARPGDELDIVPQSDGGPGFVDALSVIGAVHTTRVDGPLDTVVDARWVLSDGPAPVACLESAQAVGLDLLAGPPTPDTAVRAHSRGVGQLIAAAAAAGARRIVVGLGGSCCTDGGRGAIEALGGIDRARARLHGIDLVAATDVEHPLLGEHGAAHVFGPQKGADAATVALLERRNTAWAGDLRAAVGRDVSVRPGAGAAGGLGAALFALGAARESGATVVARVTGLTGRVAAADLVLTGEGRFDHQSLRGKLAVAVARLGSAAGVPAVVLAGQVDVPAATAADVGVTAVYSLVETAGSVAHAMADAGTHLAALTASVARAWPGTPGPIHEE
ncbi:glycerate kinase [Prescottella subtropica]|uniref:glycerate kinase family protein n=1 Tax=Prescottella subtropica TaxID=2545757 RepID=UPI0010F95BCF|nr:glycerate kinase [Prescottella subtropica]